MLKYTLRRLLIFIPSLFIISLLAFLINASAPGDPVEQLLNMGGSEGFGGRRSYDLELIKQRKRHELGLDRPLFYFSLHTLADMDTLYRVPQQAEREMLQRLARNGAPHQLITGYFNSIKAAIAQLENLYSLQIQNGAADDKFITSATSLNYHFQNLLRSYRQAEINSNFVHIHTLVRAEERLQPLQDIAKHIEADYLNLNTKKQAWKKWIPSLQLHGINNQYHHWLSKLLLHGDMGRSYRDQQEVSLRMAQRFPWSFSLALLSIVFAFAVSIPIGVLAAWKRDSLFDRASSLVLFALYSLPNFFLGTMLLVFFANPDMFNIFPAAGVQDPSVFDPNWPVWTKLWHWLPYLVLPFITYTYTSLAFLSRQMRTSLIDALKQDYVRTAQAKGLSDSKVVWKHALRNSILPLITLLGTVLPMAIGGSVIIETIFAIPGMGRETYEAIMAQDYPFITAIFLISGVLTLTGTLLADILYAMADPRISFR